MKVYQKIAQPIAYRMRDVPMENILHVEQKINVMLNSLLFTGGGTTVEAAVKDLKISMGNANVSPELNSHGGTNWYTAIVLLHPKKST